MNLKFVQGYKTYVGLLLAFLGTLGWGDLFSEAEVAELTNLLTQLIGIGLALYGRYKVGRELKAMGGYRE